MLCMNMKLIRQIFQMVLILLVLINQSSVFANDLNISNQRTHFLAPISITQDDSMIAQIIRRIDEQIQLGQKIDLKQILIEFEDQIKPRNETQYKSLLRTGMTTDQVVRILGSEDLFLAKLVYEILLKIGFKNWSKYQLDAIKIKIAIQSYQLRNHNLALLQNENYRIKWMGLPALVSAVVLIVGAGILYFILPKDPMIASPEDEKIQEPVSLISSEERRIIEDIMQTIDGMVPSPQKDHVHALFSKVDPVNNQGPYRLIVTKNSPQDIQAGVSRTIWLDHNQGIIKVYTDVWDEMLEVHGKRFVLAHEGGHGVSFEEDIGLFQERSQLQKKIGSINADDLKKDPLKKYQFQRYMALSTWHEITSELARLEYMAKELQDPAMSASIEQAMLTNSFLRNRIHEVNGGMYAAKMQRMRLNGDFIEMAPNRDEILFLKPPLVDAESGSVNMRNLIYNFIDIRMRQPSKFPLWAIALDIEAWEGHLKTHQGKSIPFDFELRRVYQRWLERNVSSDFYIFLFDDYYDQQNIPLDQRMDLINQDWGDILNDPNHPFLAYLMMDPMSDQWHQTFPLPAGLTPGPMKIPTTELTYRSEEAKERFLQYRDAMINQIEVALDSITVPGLDDVIFIVSSLSENVTAKGELVENNKKFQISVRSDLWEKIKDDESTKKILILHEFVENVLIPLILEDNLNTDHPEYLSLQDQPYFHALASAIVSIYHGADNRLMMHLIQIMNSDQLAQVMLNHINDPDYAFFIVAKNELFLRIINGDHQRFKKRLEQSSSFRDISLALDERLREMDLSPQSILEIKKWLAHDFANEFMDQMDKNLKSSLKKLIDMQKSEQVLLQKSA